MLYYKVQTDQVREEAEMRSRELIGRIVIISLMLYSAGVFTLGLVELGDAERAVENTRQELEILREENARLRQELASMPDSREMERLAREKLGMLMPGEKIFIFSKDREEPTWSRR